MLVLRIWCLIALLSLQSLAMSGNGPDYNSVVTSDDEDGLDFDIDKENSGSGSGIVNSTVSVNTAVVVTSPKSRTSPISNVKPGRTTSRTYGPVADIEDDDDSDLTTLSDLDSVVREGNEDQRMTSTHSSGSVDLMELIWKQPGIVAGLIGGAILGVLFAILLTLFIIYRLRRRTDMRSFRKGGRGSQDDAGAFWFDDEEAGAIAVSRASAERYPHSQTDAYVNPQANMDTLKSGQAVPASGVGSAQAQPLLYTPLVAPVSQTAYDEYLANLYNQQLYNGYAQKA